MREPPRAPPGRSVRDALAPLPDKPLPPRERLAVGGKIAVLRKKKLGQPNGGVGPMRFGKGKP